MLLADIPRQCFRTPARISRSSSDICSALECQSALDLAFAEPCALPVPTGNSRGAAPSWPEAFQARWAVLFLAGGCLPAITFLSWWDLVNSVLAPRPSLCIF